MKSDSQHRAELGLGCVTFGREIDEPTSFELLDYAVANGISRLDTAAAYANGASESVLGKWLAENQSQSEDLKIATKLLPPYTSETIRESVEGSLERLGVSSFDLLFLHRWDASAETSDCLAALDELVREGVVKRIGGSNFDQPQLSRALNFQDESGFTPFSVIQNNFNYAVRDVSPEYCNFCKHESVEVMTYSPLGAGFLTGKHKTSVEPGSRFDIIPGHQDVYFHEEAKARLTRLEEVAEDTGHSQAHLALAWAMHQPGIDCVLVGGRTTNHIQQSLDAWEFSDDEILSQLS